MHLRQIFIPGRVSCVSSLQSLRFGTVSHASPSNVYAGKVFISSFFSKTYSRNFFTGISFKSLCEQGLHMHLRFKVLGLELFDTHLRQMFMLANVSYASSVQSFGFGTVSHAYP